MSVEDLMASHLRDGVITLSGWVIAPPGGSLASLSLLHSNASGKLDLVSSTVSET